MSVAHLETAATGRANPLRLVVPEPADIATAGRQLRLRRLPQSRPEAWSPPPGEPAGHQVQQMLVLHGVPRPVLPGELEGGSDTVTAAADITELPCPEQLARRLLQAAVDVVRGHRPATQILRWTTPEVYSQLRQRARLERSSAAAGGRRPVLRSLRLSPSGTRAVEVSAVVLDGNRARAVAARLDVEDSRWRLTALVIG